MAATAITADHTTNLSEFVPRSFGTILADPPWRFKNRTGRIAPEYHRLHRYPSMTDDEIKALPVPDLADTESHLYLWVPNSLIQTGLEVMKYWGFEYKTNLVWFKVRKDGGPDGRGKGCGSVGIVQRSQSESQKCGSRHLHNMEYHMCLIRKRTANLTTP